MIFIGGSGSSGSSLLSIVLDRHSDIACGPELSVFNKEQFLEDFDKSRAKLPVWLDKGLRTDGYFYYYSFFCNRDAYQITREKLIEWINGSSSLKQFFDKFIQHYLQVRQKKIFAEKTPSNSYTFPKLFDLYPDAKFIHIYRDPRDVICSLRKRHYTWFQASSMWLYNTVAALRMRKYRDNYYELCYEDFVVSPENEIRGLCHFLGVDFDSAMLRSKSDRKRESGQAAEKWDLNPNRGISDKSVGRHKGELTPYGAGIFHHTCLTKHAAEHLGTDITTIPEAMNVLGYETNPESIWSKKISSLYKWEQYFDWTFRLLKRIKRMDRHQKPLTQLCS